MTFEIRQFAEPDRAAVISVWQASGITRPQNDPDLDIDRKLAAATEPFLVGTFAGEVVGTVMGGYDGSRGWIYALAVHPDHQRKGYGGQLVVAVEATLAARGCPKINLQVRAGNAAAEAFYRAIGYDVEERISFGKRLGG